MDGPSNGIICVNGLTLLVGIGVFVLGQVIMRFFVESIHERSRLIGEVVDSLVF